VPIPFSLNGSYHDPDFPDDLKSSWALTIKGSEDILVFGMLPSLQAVLKANVLGGGGFYSFFYNYAQDRLKDSSCQAHIVNVDSSSRNIYLYSISTVGITHMISVDGKAVMKHSENRNGFAATVTGWVSD